MDPLQRFQIIAVSAFVDGRIVDDEHDALLALANRLGVDRQAASDLLDRAASLVKEPIRLPKDPEERKSIFMDLVAVAAADGVADARELAFLRRTAPTLGLVPSDADEAMAKALERSKRRSSARQAAIEREEKERAVAAAKPAAAGSGTDASLLSPTAYFQYLVAAALVDGKIPAEEWEILMRYARKLGLDAGKASSMMMNPGAPDQIAPPPPDLADRGALLARMVEILAADRTVNRKEWEFLLRVAPWFGLPAGDSDRLRATIPFGVRIETGALPVVLFVLLFPVNLLLIFVGGLAALASLLNLEKPEAPGTFCLSRWDDLRSWRVPLAILLIALVAGGAVLVRWYAMAGSP